MDCIYCKVDTDGGQFTSDGDFICDDCLTDMTGDDDE
jgi:hypothetical protein